ncbi:MAG: hypothetical protein ACOYNY_37475 [Caldilineaceae bacterium]
MKAIYKGVSPWISLVGGGLLIVTMVLFGNGWGAFYQQASASVEPLALTYETFVGTPVIAYQGRLLDPVTGQPKVDGAYVMAFNLYTVATGGAPVWTESKSIQVNKGLFSTLLGDVAPLTLSIFNGQDLYLGVTVGSDPEAAPRQRIGHAAYAIYAQSAATSANATSAANADLLDGQDATAFATALHQHDKFSGSSADPILQVIQSGAGNGLQGTTAATGAAKAGVYGVAGTDAGVSTPAKAAGVLGRSLNAFGVIGYSVNDDGVYGHSSNEFGVRAESGGKAALLALAFGSGATNYGVEARSSSTHGVYADGATYGFYTPDKIFAGAGYSDIAEHMPAATDVTAGDVVVIDPDNDERVIKSYQANDPTVAGVISTDPALLIGQADSPSPLALAGRVPVKVSAENGPIRRGDLLTTAATPGHAMKATPVLINGIPFYTPGTIIGKAMGEIEAGVGIIIVLVMPQ